MAAALLIGLLFFGGAGGGLDLFTKHAHSRVKTAIPEDDRAERILSQMDYIERATSEEALRVAKLLKKWRKRDRDHGVGSESLDPVIDEAIEASETGQQHFLDGLFAMKAEMSEKEWEEVFGIDE